ncbi:MAG: hypothetical protein KIT48_02645 [Pseudolabrys sp.]|nr:hypothetical protein [Pseudolabrys sp.]
MSDTAAVRHDFIPQVVCDRCGEAPVAPDRADYLAKRGMVRYVWSCTACGHQFSTESPAALGPETEQEAVKAFWPSLLVG